MNRLRYIKVAVLGVFFTVFLQYFCFAQSNETLTITTFYPSPYGSYRELQVTGGSTYWTTFNWVKALVIGDTEARAIQFTGVGRFFGLGASATNNFYGWSANSGTSSAVANYWLRVEGNTTPQNIFLRGNVNVGEGGGNLSVTGNSTVSGNLTVTGTSNICVTVNYDTNAPISRGCPPSYVLAAGSFVDATPSSGTLNVPTAGYFVCCKACTDNNRDGSCD